MVSVCWSGVRVWPAIPVLTVSRSIYLAHRRRASTAAPASLTDHTAIAASVPQVT